MNLLTKEPPILWGAVVIVFLTVLWFVTPEKPGGDTIDDGEPMSVQRGYTGPTGGFAATPLPGSLVYSMPEDPESSADGESPSSN